MPTLHTERGDVHLSDREMSLYKLLARERTQVYTLDQLARETGDTLRTVAETARSLRAAIRQDAGLEMVVPAWGIGYALEPIYERRAT